MVATMMAPMAVAVDPEELFMAISAGKLETVKSLMEQGGQVTWATPEGIIRSIFLCICSG